jgi:hypothetical protein
MFRPKTRITDTANAVIAFTTAATWVGLWSGEARFRGNKTSCPFCWDGGGRDPAFRVYPDHGYCFAGCGYFTVTRLLAMSWGLRNDEAAWQALERAGWKPPTRAERWERATADAAPDREALAKALKYYCAAADPQWERRQVTEPYASVLSSCLGVLPLVQTAEECDLWLTRCKEVMNSLLAGTTTSDLLAVKSLSGFYLIGEGHGWSRRAAEGKD